MLSALFSVSINGFGEDTKEIKLISGADLYA